MTAEEGTEAGDIQSEGGSEALERSLWGWCMLPKSSDDGVGG